MATASESEPSGVSGQNNTFTTRETFAADIRTITGRLPDTGDVDFLSFVGLAAGTSFVAETLAVAGFGRLLDPTLTRFDDAGTQIAVDFDSGVENQARLTGTIGTTGTLNLSLSAENEQFGDYTLLLSLLLSGGGLADTLLASNYSESIVGLAGNDTITAQGGEDTVDAGDGDDLVRGGGGLDSILGGTGADSLDGGGGSDTLDGGNGNDTLAGGAGDDTYVLTNAGDVVIEAVGGGIDTVRTATLSVVLAAEVERLEFSGGLALFGSGNALANTLLGNAGDDSLAGLEGNDSIAGNAGDDILFGGSFVVAGGNDGANTIAGNDGDDVLVGGTGNDSLDGGAGNDFLDGGLGVDTLRGGSGDDFYQVDTPGDLVREQPFGGIDTIFSFLTSTVLGTTVENLRLASFASVLNGTGNGLGNSIEGNNFDNSLVGLAGDDSLDGETGADTLDGGDGRDRINGGAGDDLLRGGAGDDTLTADNNFDEPGANTLDGGDGDDLLDGGNVTRLGFIGNDLLRGGAGNDTLFDGDGLATLEGGAGNDCLQGGDGDDNLFGGAGDDTLLDGAGDDTIDGGAGNDVLLGEAGDDSVSGGAGDDTIDGSLGADVLVGGLGADQSTGGGATRFTYRSVAESTADLFDVVSSFEGAGAVGGDLIDLEAIDVVPGGGDDDFTFVGGAAFSAPGQIRVELLEGVVTVQGNLDADLETIEFFIVVNGQTLLTAGDFDL